MKKNVLLTVPLFALLAFSMAGCINDVKPERSYSSAPSSVTSYTESKENCEHEYGAWSVEKSPDCTHDGVKSRKCPKCGQIERVSIPATGHEFHNGICTICGAEEGQDSSSSEEPNSNSQE